LVVDRFAELVHDWVGKHREVCVEAIELLDYIFDYNHLKDKNQTEKMNFKLLDPWIKGGLAFINLGKIDQNHWAFKALNSKEEKKTAEIMIRNSTIFSTLQNQLVEPFKLLYLVE
jgi:hypothetical protein